MTASQQPDAERAPLTSPAAAGSGSSGHDKAVEWLADVRLCAQLDRNLPSASWGDGEKETTREAIKASRGIWAHYLRDAEVMLSHLRAALAAGDADVAEALDGRIEWTVRHAQGTHPGPFTEARAREWAEADVERDARRRYDCRGKTQLLRRFVTDWTEAP